MTDRELIQNALDALTYVGDKEIYSDTIDALRARLSQHDDFNPDWDAMAVMVEEQQRMAKRIEELTQLVTSQGIRLMDAEAQPEQKPVAWKMKGVPAFATSRPNDTDSIKWDALYTAPPQREWVGLTGEELQEIYQSAGTAHFKFAMVEAKLKEKNT